MQQLSHVSPDRFHLQEKQQLHREQNNATNRPTNNYHTYVTPDHFHLQENQQLRSRRHWESLQRGTPWVCFEHMGQ